MAEYKLYYFDARGRGEVIRLVFAAVGQKYEDIRFSREKWPEFKPKAPFGQAPFIEIKEGSETISMGQTIAITRYLARKFGLAGKNDKESALVDMYGAQLDDLTQELAKAFRESDPEKKKEIQAKLASETIPHNLKFFEDRLAKSGSGFVASSGLTWVDLFLYVTADWLGPNKDQILENFKHIKENRAKIEAVPGIANWLKVRPVTEM